MKRSEAKSLIASIGRATKAFFAKRADLTALEARVAAIEATQKAAGPGFRYRGVWSPDAEYREGDCCTFDGCLWYAHDTTAARPGDGDSMWQLAVKRGRDGRDARR